MEIKGVQTKGFSQYLHHSVYGSVDESPSFKRRLYEPPDYIANMVGVSSKNKHVYKMAVRVALIYAAQQNVLKRLMEKVEQGDGSEDRLKVLNRIKSCQPAGVDLASKHKKMHCRKYSVCPWCRFRKARAIMAELDKLRENARQLAFITVTVPQVLVSHSDQFIADHRAVIRSLCKDRDLFLADHVVTVPNWWATHEEVDCPIGADRVYTFNFETTIIGLSESEGKLPLPENCLSPSRRKHALLGGTGSGTWTRGRPTKKLLGQAMRAAMGFSPSLLSSKLNPHEYTRALSLQANMRAVSHSATES
jgi:hypothetical protein